MRPRPLIASAHLILIPILGVSLVGCFKNTNPPPPVGGNWVTTISPDGQKAALSGALALSGLFDSVTGVTHITGLPCVSDTSPLATTGKQDIPSLETKLSMALGSNNTMNIVGTQSADLSMLTGTFAMKDSSCGGIATGHITATKYAPLSGTYAGSLNLSQGGALEISTLLSQNDLADEEGKYPVSGAATMTSFKCASGWTLADSFVTGDHFLFTYVSSDNSSQLSASGTFFSNAKNITVNSFAIDGGSCDGYSGAGVLSLRPSGQ